MKDIIYEYGNSVLGFFAGVGIIALAGAVCLRSEGVLSRLFGSLVAMYL